MTDAEKREAIAGRIKDLPNPCPVDLQTLWKDRTEGLSEDTDDFFLLWVVREGNELEQRKEAQRRLDEREREIGAQKDAKTNVDYS